MLKRLFIREQMKNNLPDALTITKAGYLKKTNSKKIKVNYVENVKDIDFKLKT